MNFILYTVPRFLTYYIQEIDYFKQFKSIILAAQKKKKQKVGIEQKEIFIRLSYFYNCILFPKWKSIKMIE